MTKYQGSLEGQDMEIIIRNDQITVSDEKKTLMVFIGEEKNLVVQINTNERGEEGGYKECLTFFIPESVRPIFESMFFRRR